MSSHPIAKRAGSVIRRRFPLLEAPLRSTYERLSAYARMRPTRAAGLLVQRHLPFLYPALRGAYHRLRLAYGEVLTAVAGAKRLVRRYQPPREEHVRLCAAAISPEWYCRVHKLPRMNRTEVARHFLKSRIGLSPHPLFEGGAYLAHNPQAYPRALNLYVDFLLHAPAGRALTSARYEQAIISVEDFSTISCFARLNGTVERVRAAAEAAAPSRPVPGVSIVVRSMFQRPKLLARAVRSIIARDDAAFPIDVEILIIHAAKYQAQAAAQAGLLAELGEEAAALGRTEIRVLSSPKEHRSALLNLGLAQATRPYFAILDDDDFLYPNHLPALLAVLEQRPDLSACYAAADIIYTVGTDDHALEFASGEVNFSVWWWWPKLVRMNIFPIQAVISRRGDLKGLTFDEQLDALEDWLFWIEAFRGRAVAGVPLATSAYRVPHPDYRRSGDRVGAHEEYRRIVQETLRRKGLEAPGGVDLALAKPCLGLTLPGRGEEEPNK